MTYPVPIPPGVLSPGFEKEGTPAHVARGPYGIQSRREWTAADVEPKDIVDALRSEYVWRVSAIGANVELQLHYGTQGTLVVPNIRVPFVGVVPGQVTLRAQKVAAGAPANVLVTLTAATGGLPVVRTVIPAPQALPNNTSQYTALTASTLTVAGIAGIAVAVGASLPIVAPSAVTAGAGIAELAL